MCVHGAVVPGCLWLQDVLSRTWASILSSLLTLILSDFLSIVHSILFAPLSQFHSGLLRETKVLLTTSLSFETGDQENKFATFSVLSFSKMTSVVLFYHMVAACIHLFKCFQLLRKSCHFLLRGKKYYVRLPYFYLEPKFHINCLNQTNISRLITVRKYYKN